MGNVWTIIAGVLKKEKPRTVLFFVFHMYYNRSIKDLAEMFKVRADSVSKDLNRVAARIREEYQKTGDLIGRDGERIGGEALEEEINYGY